MKLTPDILQHVDNGATHLKEYIMKTRKHETTQYHKT